jgi:hypothetical protein
VFELSKVIRVGQRLPKGYSSRVKLGKADSVSGRANEVSPVASGLLGLV